MTGEAPDRGAHWWRTAVVYEIYLRSFADSDADGIGDFAGLRAHLDHLVDLSVDAVWLTPFYPSPLADGGYDVADHQQVDPRLGTLADFDAFVADAHRVGIKVLIDVVPNHTSDTHPWFVEALAAEPGSAARERYIFRNGGGPHGELPPSDWRSHFGGSAWDRERVGDGQWYCHLFTREQPDLNWDSPEVREYFLGTLRFWADHGVDGFRVDVAHTLVKDLTEPLRSQVTLDLELPADGSDPLYDREDVHTIYEGWRRVFDSYTPPRMAVAETWHPATARTYRYARPTELGQVFDFSLSKCAWDREQFASAIERSLAHHRDGGGGLTWVLSSHDMVRHASRLALPIGADVESWLLSNGTAPTLNSLVGRRRARAATMLMLALPGSPYLFQGEEIGLLEVADLSIDGLDDPTWVRTGGARKGRDGCRVPLPWTRRGGSFGFGLNGSWLPQPHSFGAVSVQEEDLDPNSSLSMYRRALAVRRRLAIDDDTVEWLSPHDHDVVHFRRANGWQCLTNFSATAKQMPAGRVVMASAAEQWHVVPAESTVWLTDVV